MLSLFRWEGAAFDVPGGAGVFGVGKKGRESNVAKLSPHIL